MTATLEQASRDYRRVARAIGFLHEHRLGQPSLASVAAHVGLSPHHFQRMFLRWAGVSPKRFLQFLSREHAKTLLASGASILDATFGSGHSSPARLHDLFVRTEAITPGEFRAGGAGLVIRHGVHPSPFGDCFVAVTERGVCAMAFVDSEAELGVAHARVEHDFPRARLTREEDATRAVVERIFSRSAEASAAPIGVMLAGSVFQLRVWQALLELPEGHVRSYGELARTVGQPTAVRAAASASARNRVAYLVPCHRIIRAVGDSGEYRWGRERKQLMLAWEQARRAACTEKCAS